MVFYEAKILYAETESEDKGIRSRLSVDENSDQFRKVWIDLIKDLNQRLGAKCGLDGNLSTYIYNAQKGELQIIIAANLENVSLEKCEKYLLNLLEEKYAVKQVEMADVKEITVERFNQLGDRANDNEYLRRWRSESNNIGTDYFQNSQFSIEEILIREEDWTLEVAKEKAARIMASDSFIDELERIYSQENEKCYYGNPVHYKISASNTQSAMDMVNVLVSALKTNARLLGTRVSRIFDIKEGCYREDDLNHMFELAQGNAVVIELAGNDEDHGCYASAYQEVIDEYCRLIRKYHLYTLCIFVEIIERPGFAKTMVAKVQEEVDLIDMREGCGSREVARCLINQLIEKTGIQVSDEDIESILGEKKTYTVGEVYGIYNKWFKNGLKRSVYKAYKNYCSVEIKKVDHTLSEPYKELQKMVGLQEVKGVVDSIIDTAKIRKLRTDMGMDSYKNALHMIFTGNPGSAKTTVARLLAQILVKEGVLESGNYVECGRADLVGKYVGWTAKTVKAKFREAKGGVLFIDEAYALVDASNSFGDEAINTIVQEMENHREDVVVIFAGYPEKMKEFLNKNEGLRSRIAFQLDFPDYKAGEMLQILKLMATERGYELDEKTCEKCFGIFEAVCSQEEFGNGRFVRNLLEQAEMAQSHRIVSECKGKKVGSKKLKQLRAEDFDVNISRCVKDKKRAIGFAM